MKRRLRIDDMRRIAEPLSFLLVHEAYRYGGAPIDTLDGFTLHVAPYHDRARLRIPLRSHAPITFTERPASIVSIATVDLDRQTLAREERLTRYDRRRRARLGGRREAVSVALVTRWRVDVFAEQGTSEVTIERAANAHATIVERAWRHGDAVDWARRALARRQKAERKKAKKS